MSKNKFETPILQEYPLIPKIQQDASVHLAPFKSKEEFQSSLGYPGDLVDNWKEKAIDIAKQNNSYDKNKHVFKDMLSKETNIEHMKKLKYLTGLQDFSRGKHLKDYHSICYDMLEDIQ